PFRGTQMREKASHSIFCFFTSQEILTDTLTSFYWEPRRAENINSIMVDVCQNHPPRPNFVIVCEIYAQMSPEQKVCI
ncbi:MAG: hypothetical protein Q7W05_02475, partial [Deltaproteobacteria bacterium]|nr:hypothetical protein [Deltaproteobacteria bacterium]